MEVLFHDYGFEGDAEFVIDEEFDGVHCSAEGAGDGHYAVVYFGCGAVEADAGVEDADGGELFGFFGSDEGAVCEEDDGEGALFCGLEDLEEVGAEHGLSACDGEHECAGGGELVENGFYFWECEFFAGGVGAGEVAVYAF